MSIITKLAGEMEKINVLSIFFKSAMIGHLEHMLPKLYILYICKIADPEYF